MIRYGAQIAGALAAAHAAGIVHRRREAGHVIVTAEGQVKVLDFGLAKLAEAASDPDSETQTVSPRLTEAGMVMGALAYMPPEQARAEEADARTDLFSFGAVLYEMATGRRAFLKALDWRRPPANSLPPELRRIAVKLLEVDRELRYRTAADLAADLKRLQPSSERKPDPRRWWISSPAALAAVAFDAVFFYFHLQQDRPAPRQVYVKMLPDGEPVQLTHDNLEKMSPVFSPDGSRIAYTVEEWSRGIVGLDPIGALARLQLGRAYALSGDKVKAQGAYQDFLTLWKDAGSDIPILRQAKSEYAKLQVNGA